MANNLITRKDPTMSLCTYVENATRCPEDATHFVWASFDRPSVWSVSDTPWQLESLSGFKMTVPQLDFDGKPLLDKSGKRLPNLPVFHVREFCLVHAEIVCDQRMALKESVAH